MGKKIAVAGKGGTGKSTIAALFIACLKERGELPILAIDADPDSNLGVLLGIRVDKTLGDLREEILKDIKNFPAGMSKQQYIESGLHQVIEESEGFDLISMGRGEGSSCYCYLNSLVRKFSENLVPLYKWLVMDNEAGLEHISRRTTSKVDALFIIVNENPLSIATAHNIDIMTEGMSGEIGEKYIIINGVSKEHRSKVLESVKDCKAEYIGDIPFDPKVEEFIFNGRSLIELDGSAAKESVNKILDKFIEK